MPCPTAVPADLCTSTQAVVVFLCCVGFGAIVSSTAKPAWAGWASLLALLMMLATAAPIVQYFNTCVGRAAMCERYLGVALTCAVGWWWRCVLCQPGRDEVHEGVAGTGAGAAHQLTQLCAGPVQRGQEHRRGPDVLRAVPIRRCSVRVSPQSKGGRVGTISVRRGVVSGPDRAMPWAVAVVPLGSKHRV